MRRLSSLSLTFAPRRGLSSTPAIVEFVQIRDPVDHNALKNVRICRSTTPVPHPHTPPLIIIGGTAQTIESWTGNLQQLATCGRYPRQVIMYETRGQGMTNLSLDDATISRHVEDFAAVMDKLGLSSSSSSTGENHSHHHLNGGGSDAGVDICGFSFGGRLALAIAARKPHLVRRLVLTGVGADRDAYGRLAFEAWKVALKSGSIEAMLYNSVLHSYSAQFISKHEASFAKWIESAAHANNQGDCKGVLAILEQTHAHDPSDPWHPVQLARQVQEDQRIKVLLISGGEDRLSPPMEAGRLAAMCQWPVYVVPGSGHMVPIEQPLQWRRKVVDFLDGSSESAEMRPVSGPNTDIPHSCCAH